MAISETKSIDQKIALADESEKSTPLHNYILNPRWRLVIVCVCAVAFIFGLVFILLPHAFTVSQELGIGLASLSVPILTEEFSKAYERREHETELVRERRKHEVEVKMLTDALEEANKRLQDLKTKLDQTRAALGKSTEEALERSQIDAAILGFWTCVMFMGHLDPLAKSIGEPRVRSACARLGIAQLDVDEFLKNHEIHYVQEAVSDASEATFRDALRRFTRIIEASLPNEGLRYLFNLTGNAAATNITFVRVGTQLVRGNLGDQTKAVETCAEVVDNFKKDYALAKPVFAEGLTAVFEKFVSGLSEMENVVRQIPQAKIPERAKELGQVIYEMAAKLANLLADLA